jgi:hypothetical protein
MLGLGLGTYIKITSGLNPSGYDPDAQAFFDRVTTAGGSLTTTEQNAVNQLVVDMKSYGIWTSMKAIYPMVGASAAACAQNLKSLSFTGTFSSGWTFASTGATPNGTSAYFNSNLNISTNLSLNSVHLSYYSKTNATGTQSEIGAYYSGTNVGTFLAYAYAGGNYKGLNAPSTNVGSAFTPTTGFLLGSRINSTTEKYYFKGTLTDTVSITSNSLINYDIYLGAHNINGSANNFSIKQCAFASIGDGLTDTQASNFYTAVQAFQTTLSRQV